MFCAAPAAALALVATSPGPPDLRLPNDGEEAWDPGLPLFLDWSGGPRLPVNDPQFQAGFSLRKRPARPHWNPMSFSYRLPQRVPDAWRGWIFE